MKLIELLPLIECSTVNVYEKRRYGPPRFIVLINPKKNKGCISDDLLDRDIRSISISYRDGFNICVCKKKDDEELVDKADSFEWIPVSERLPEEHDSIFAKLYGTDLWGNNLWRARSEEVLVTLEYEDGIRTVKSSHTTDGKWWIEKKTTLSKFKVIAWMPMPEPYKENENE